MSEIRVTTLKDTSGGNASTSAQIYSGRAKVWVNFNGIGTVSVRASFNVNSIGDNGTGDYTVNFSNSLTDTNFSAVVSGWNQQDSGGSWCVAYNGGSGNYPTGVTTGSFRIFNGRHDNSAYADTYLVNVAVFR